MDTKEDTSTKNRTENTNTNANALEKNLSGKKTNTKIRKQKVGLIEELKMEIASELGIAEQIQDKGWDSLSPRVSGKIGGKLSQKLKKMGQ